jgi:hypothetical protein
MTFLRASTLSIVFVLLSTSTALVSAAEQTSSTPILGLVNASQDRSQDHILEFWGYHEYDGSQNYEDTLKLRYYNPLNIADWHGTMRLDAAYTASYGPQQAAQSTGTYSANNAMLTIWGGEAGWVANVGARVIAPLSNSGQWLAGPQVSTSFIPAGNQQTLLADISPLARYMIGFNAKAPSGTNAPPLASRLELYPTIGLNLGPNTQLRFWDENGAVYNAAGGGWFVPIDAMVTQRLNKNLLVAIGGAKQVVQTYQLYNWTVYGKISLSF